MDSDMEYKDKDHYSDIQRQLPCDVLSRYLTSVVISFADVSLLQVCEL